VADFTVFRFQLNTGSNGTPTWTAVPATGAGTGQELRFSDLSTQGAVASASWPFTTRPISGTSGVDYLYVFTADTTSLGSLGGGTNTPAAFSNANYMEFRLDWDNTGTFASAPIYTAYPSNAHGAVSRGDASILGGQTTDTGATQRSYLKGNAFGRVVSGGAPAAAPTNAPVVTDGTTGTVSPTAGANWLTNYQGLQGDNDFITAPFTPTAVTADQWNLMIRLFMGANETPGTYTPVVSAKYTYT
jgi:hypothetical protein